MSTAVIVALVALVLAIMVGTAITLQTIEKNNKERRRREAGLKARARNFLYMLEGFPDGFLGRDLRSLVIQSLLDVNNQLIELSPKEKQHQESKEHYLQLVDQVKNEPKNNAEVQLTDPVQIKETQKLLGTLNGFISKLLIRGQINEKQSHTYTQQIKQLTTQSAVDALECAVKNALQTNKDRLAVHYLKMAIDEIKKGAASKQLTQRVERYEQQIDDIENKSQEESVQSKTKDTEKTEPRKEDTSWKKNAIYD